MVGIQGCWPGAHTKEVNRGLPHHSAARASIRRALHQDHPICNANSIGLNSVAQAPWPCMGQLCVLTPGDVVQILQPAGACLELTGTAWCAAALWLEGEVTCAHTHASSACMLVCQLNQGAASPCITFLSHQRQVAPVVVILLPFVEVCMLMHHSVAAAAQQHRALSGAAGHAPARQTSSKTEDVVPGST